VRFDAGTGRLVSPDHQTEYTRAILTLGTGTPAANVRLGGSFANGLEGGAAGINTTTTINTLVLNSVFPGTSPPISNSAPRIGPSIAT
jgi:hypothetical protein